MTTEDEVGPGENLGRGVFSSRDARRATRGRVSLNVFLEKVGVSDLSVDRLDLAAPGEAAAIADGVANARSRSFHGWAVVIAGTAALNGRTVAASPQLDNPHHADIVLPDSVVEDREEQKRHAQELADASSWRDRNADS